MQHRQWGRAGAPANGVLQYSACHAGHRFRLVRLERRPLEAAPSSGHRRIRNTSRRWKWCRQACWASTQLAAWRCRACTRHRDEDGCPCQISWWTAATREPSSCCCDMAIQCRRSHRARSGRLRRELATHRGRRLRRHHGRRRHPVRRRGLSGAHHLRCRHRRLRGSQVRTHHRRHSGGGRHRGLAEKGPVWTDSAFSSTASWSGLVAGSWTPSCA